MIDWVAKRLDSGQLLIYSAAGLDPTCLQKHKCGSSSERVKKNHFLQCDAKQTTLSRRPFCIPALTLSVQTGWIQASSRATRQLAWDPTCLLLSPPFPIKIKQNSKVLKTIFRKLPSIQRVKLEQECYNRTKQRHINYIACKCTKQVNVLIKWSEIKV